MIALEAGDGEDWTVHVSGGRMSVARGRPDGPTVRIISDPATLGEVLAGERDPRIGRVAARRLCRVGGHVRRAA